MSAGRTTRDVARRTAVSDTFVIVGLREAVYSLYERRLRRHLDGLPVPRHVAIMIDGNRRWARAAGFDDVSQGHVVGARHIANLLEWCGEADRKSTRLNSSHSGETRMPSSA